jgi:beta-glucosidase
MNGRPLAISWEATHVPAILETWFLGTQAGNAIADLVFGKFSPSGRLPVSFPRSSGQIPVYYNHKNTGRPVSETEYFTSHYLDLPSTPLYPFGFGLTYTSFAYSNLRIEHANLGTGDTLRATVVVHNAGTRAGDETVQLYVKDEVATVTRPVRELKGFNKVRIEAGQSATVALTVPVSELAFTGIDMKALVEPGSFQLFVGPNSAEGLQESFVVSGK